MCVLVQALCLLASLLQPGSNAAGPNYLDTVTVLSSSTDGELNTVGHTYVAGFLAATVLTDADGARTIEYSDHVSPPEFPS